MRVCRHCLARPATSKRGPATCAECKQVNEREGTRRRMTALRSRRKSQRWNSRHSGDYDGRKTSAPGVPGRTPEPADTCKEGSTMDESTSVPYRGEVR